MKRQLQFLSVIALVMCSLTANAQIIFYVEDPQSIEGSYPITYVGPPNWGVDMTTVSVTDTLVLVDDGTTSDSLGCNALVNSSAVDGNIAVIYRGACEFGTKALNAQLANAVGVIIINNVPGGPVGMGAGSDGGFVNIPVVMVSQSDGASIRAAMNAGTVVGFMGNKSGLFPNDLTMSMKDVVLAESYAQPINIAADGADFSIPLGAWVYNSGYEAQTNVQLIAEIEDGSGSIFSDTSSGVTLNPGDSSFFALNVFSPSSYAKDFYTLRYTIVSDSADNFGSDNMVESNFWINDTYYSKSRMDPVTGTPIGSGGLRSANSTEFTWCVAMTDENYGGLTATDITFATVTNSSTDLIGKLVGIEFYEWNNELVVSDDSISELTNQVFYEYNADLQDSFLTVALNPGEQGINLENNQKYLACVKLYMDDHFIVRDGQLDYSTTINEYEHFMFPLFSSQWYAGGFGADAVPAIAVHLEPTVVGISNPEKINIQPYPNPASDFITVPLDITGAVQLSVLDITGKEVLNGNYVMDGNHLRVNTENLSSGTYYFSLTSDKIEKMTFPVVITR